MADVFTRIGYIKGETGATGAQGAKGDQGDAATIEVGTVTTVPYGQTANVTNSGTSGAAVFDFTIPQGKPGEQTTDMQNLTLGSITTSSASFPVPAVGETGKVLWGKVVKWFSDMSALVATKLNVSNVVNNLTTTAEGYALDARQGKTMNDRMDTMNVVSVQRVTLSATTGTSGNISLNIENTGFKYVLCPFVATNLNHRAYAWVASSNVWFVKIIDVNTGNSVVNTPVNLRYILLTIANM